jgi:hypothetical protein
MKKEILINVNASTVVEVDIPDHLLEELENTYNLKMYKKINGELIYNELYNIINEKINIHDLDWDDIEILEILEDEN